MLRPHYSQKNYRVYMREIKAVGLMGLLIFVACALYSYSPEDCSYMHYTTRSIQHVYNWCGIFGAHCAALLLYMFGAAAYGVCVFLLAGVYFLIKDVSLAEEWDRILAGVGLIVVGAGLCSMYQFNCNMMEGAGGVVGIQLINILYQWFDHVGGMVCMYVLFYMFLIVFCRFSFMGFMCSLIHMGVGVVKWCYRFMRDYHIVHYLYSASAQLVYYIKIPFGVLYHFIWTLLDGSAFDGTSLMVPDVSSSDDLQDFDMHIHGHTHTETNFDDVDSEVMHGISHTYNASKRGVEHDMHDHDAWPSTIVPQMADTVVKDSFDHTTDQTVDQKSAYVLPHISFFVKGAQTAQDTAQVQELEARAQLLQEKLERFGVKGTVVAIKRGPVVTLFEYQPHIDAKLSKIIALEDDLAMALKALSIRILAPIPGRSVVGFEVANSSRADVLLADTIHSQEYKTSTAMLPLILGQDTIGNGVIVDLARMPHLLIAGSTGSGKSVGLNSMLISLLCARTPDELKLILIDPKRLEFTSYAHIAHLLFPIITDTKAAVPILKWVAAQMDERYEKMAACGARNIFDYNAPRDKRDSGNEKREHMPFIVVIIDELADLMITVGREVEDVIARITQMARAAGIHLIVATQRPSVDVITGFIKVNFPSRISFRVTSRIDSRTILDCGGADKLLGRGDMLFLDSTTSLLKRVHGAYVSDAEIAQVTNHIRAEREVAYLDIMHELQKEQANLNEKDDMLYGQVLDYLDEIESLSISSLQRRFKIGYNRSARIIDQLEATGRIMPADGSKTRRIIK